MKLGYNIFSCLKDFKFIYEVFPSASYKMLEGEIVKYEICLMNFNQGIKDMLDASAAAMTVKEYLEGSGSQVVFLIRINKKSKEREIVRCTLKDGEVKSSIYKA